jgi:hypothetical protein
MTLRRGHFSTEFTVAKINLSVFVHAAEKTVETVHSLSQVVPSGGLKPRCE